ncbi:DUF1800 domain-containing protein [Planctomycetota bacterium]|nr:DUF1800 domain-containing protein [Planctomycetota bacterium]
MNTNTSLLPLADSEFKWFQARHLLWRAGFGATTDEVDRYAALGLKKAVKELVNYFTIDDGNLPSIDLNPDVMRPPSRQERMMIQKLRKEKKDKELKELRSQRKDRIGEDRDMFSELQMWWLKRMFATPRPLEERLTLLWHSHFASKQQSVRDAYLMYQQNNLFRENASGSFADLARAIIRDPAMIKFLNNNQNNKRKPNENLARELMELFTLGEGHYTEDDIREGARALTGFTFNDNDFSFNKRNHDSQTKTILGETGTHTGDDFVNLLLNNIQCSRFIAFKIYRHFVADITDLESDLTTDQQQVIGQLAATLRNNNYKISSALTVLFESQHFYDPNIVGRKVKSPIHLLATTVRSLSVNVRSDRALRYATKMMGQQPFEPPSVAGWDVGQSWINTSTLVARHNFTTAMIAGTKFGRKKHKFNNTNAYDPMPLVKNFDLSSTPSRTIVDHLANLTLGDIPANRKQPLYSFVSSQENLDRQSLIQLLLLLTTMPEYQLC